MNILLHDCVVVLLVVILLIAHGQHFENSGHKNWDLVNICEMYIACSFLLPPWRVITSFLSCAVGGQ